MGDIEIGEVIGGVDNYDAGINSYGTVEQGHLEAYQHMTSDDVLNAVGLAGILMYFFIPTLIIIATVSCVIKIRQRVKRKKQLRYNIRQRDIQEDRLPTRIPSKPSDHEKFKGLAIEFDESGRAK